jgi:hypothetical protein
LSERRNLGGVAEWSKAAVLKTAERKLRRFESYRLRQFDEQPLRRVQRGEVTERPMVLAC